MPAASTAAIIVEGREIAVTNPDKLLWPESGITKLRYIERLAALSPYLLHYCKNRYMTTIRYPDGIQGKSFYQKNSPEPIPSFVKTAKYKNINYVHCDTVSTLVWLANLACLEFHPSLHLISDELPAEWLIDIDPPSDNDPRIWEAAALVGEILQSLHIRAVPKTSGATGVQIFIPIRRGYTFAQLREAGRFIGEYLVQKHPDLFTIERLKKLRGDRIYFDYLQHWPGKTLSAPYTPRARPHAPISTPLAWEELRPGLNPADFNLLTIEERLETRGDIIRAISPQSLDHLLTFLSKRL